MSKDNTSVRTQADPLFAPTAIEPFLFLYITEKCQLRCTHCYMGERLEAERHMEVTLVREILVNLRIVYGQYKVYLLGGEPTTHPKFLDILCVCREQGYKVVLTSNGIFPEKIWKHLCLDSIDS